MTKKLVLVLSGLLLVATSFFFSATPVAAETYTIKMGADDGQLKFIPETLIVKPGDTVKWINNKLAPHNAIFNASKITASVAKKLSHKQLLFSSGQYYETTFPENTPSGEYPYYCQPHRGAGMVGKIIVEN